MMTRIIFDNGGGIVLQLDGWAHYYDDPRRAAEDYVEFECTRSTRDWDGHEDDAAEFDPMMQEEANGGYRILYAEDVTDLLREPELWADPDVCEYGQAGHGFLSAVAESHREALAEMAK